MSNEAKVKKGLIVDGHITASGNISGANIHGTFIGDGNNLTLDAFASSIIPASSASDLGSPSNPWGSLYVTNSSIHLGSNVLSVSGGQLKLDDEDVVRLDGITLGKEVIPDEYNVALVASQDDILNEQSFNLGISTITYTNASFSNDSFSSKIDGGPAGPGAELNIDFASTTIPAGDYYVTMDVNNLDIMLRWDGNNTNFILTENTVDFSGTTEYVYKSTLTEPLTGVTGLYAYLPSGSMYARFGVASLL